MNDQNYYAGRDVSYKEYSARWSSYTVGLTPAQLKGYSAYVCAHLAVVDLGKDAEETWHWRLDYPSIEDYFASVGQQPGQDPGSAGGNSSNNDASGRADTIDLSPLPIPAETALLNVDFDTDASGVEVEDEQDTVLEPDILTEADTRFLHIEADHQRSIYLTNAEAWTDYVVEARVRVRDATLILLTRMADDHCAAYGAEFSLFDASVRLHRFGQNCVDRPLQMAQGLKMRSGQWVTLELEVAGDQLMVTVDDNTLLTMQDDRYQNGFPALRLLPALGMTGELDIDSLRVIPIYPPGDSLVNYAAAPGVVIEELQQLGLVLSGHGQLVFAEPLAYFNGKGNWFQPMASSAPRTDIVMAGSLKFTRDGGILDLETCSLMARVNMKGVKAVQELEVGFNSLGALYVKDFFDPNSELTTYTSSLLGSYKAGQTYHLLFTLAGSHLVAYVDGARALTVNNLHSRSGTFGIGLNGAGAKSRCEGRNIWVYSFR